MTKHDLKELAAMGAKLGAAKAENERLRGLLERIRTTCCQVRDAQDLDTAPGLSAAESLHEQIEKLDAALSPQAEPCGGCGNADESKRCIGCGHQFTPAPTDTFTAVEMATAAAQGFRDGQAAVEQATAQDEKAAFDDWYPLGCPGAGVTAHLSARAGFRAGAAWRRNRPAQTEQQAVAWQCRCVCEECVDAEWSQCSVEQYQMALADPDMQARALYAAPIAQTAPQGKFRMGDLVKKSSGSEWEGRVVGWYSTEQTKEGYAVESEAHSGSVQIYPAKALELVPMAAKEA